MVEEEERMWWWSVVLALVVVVHNILELMMGEHEQCAHMLYYHGVICITHGLVSASMILTFMLLLNNFMVD